MQVSAVFELQAARTQCTITNAMAAARTFAPNAPPAVLSRQIRAFVEHIDLLGETLTIPRRPQDAQEPECSQTELRILAALGRAEPVAMTGLAATLEIPASTLTRAVDKLARKGFVQRRRIRRDRRIVEVGFSPRGKEIHRFVQRERLGRARAALATLNPIERTRFMEMVAKLAGARESTRVTRVQPGDGKA